MSGETSEEGLKLKEEPGKLTCDGGLALASHKDIGSPENNQDDRKGSQQVAVDEGLDRKMHGWVGLLLRRDDLYRHFHFDRQNKATLPLYTRN